MKIKLKVKSNNRLNEYEAYDNFDPKEDVYEFKKTNEIYNRDDSKTNTNKIKILEKRKNENSQNDQNVVRVIDLGLLDDEKSNSDSNSSFCCCCCRKAKHFFRSQIYNVIIVTLVGNI